MPWQIIYRVHANAVYSYLKMQMVACGPARGANICDCFALRYILSCINMKIAAMTIKRYNSVIVLNHYIVTIAAC